MGKVNTNTEVAKELVPYEKLLQVDPTQDAKDAEIGPTLEKPLIKPLKGMYFHSVPSLLVWIFIISAFMSISVGLIGPYINKILHTIKESKISITYRLTIIGSVLIIGLITFFLEHSNTSFLKYPVEYKTVADLLKEFNILLDDPKKTIKVAVGIMFSVAFTGMAGLLILNKAINNIQSDSIKQKEEVHKVTLQYNRLRSDLKFYLYSLSLLVAGSILTTGMLRESILTIIPSANDFIFPIEFVYLYGLSFSLILIIAYVPIFANLKYKSQKIVAGVEGLSAQYQPEKLKAIKEKLSVQSTIFDNIKVVISLLAPLITSFLPNFM
ncbi:hypothetical protein ACFLSE_05825 [Bacteroidota bacterium]